MANKPARRSAYAVTAIDIEYRHPLNQRDDYGDIEELADQLVAAADGTDYEAVIVAEVTVVKIDGKLYPTDGNRRMGAVKLLVDEREVDPRKIYVPISYEKKGATKVDILLRQIFSNNGKPYTFWEECKIVRKLMEEGYTKPGELVKMTGWSNGKVSDRLCVINGLTSEQFDWAKGTDVAPSSVMQAIRETDSPGEAVEVIRIAISDAAAEGRKVSKAHIRNAAADMELSNSEESRLQQLSSPNEAIELPEIAEAPEPASTARQHEAIEVPEISDIPEPVPTTRQPKVRKAATTRTDLLEACVKFDNWDAVSTQDLHRIAKIFGKYPEAAGEPVEMEQSGSTVDLELSSMVHRPIYP